MGYQRVGALHGFAFRNSQSFKVVPAEPQRYILQHILFDTIHRRSVVNGGYRLHSGGLRLGIRFHCIGHRRLCRCGNHSGLCVGYTSKQGPPVCSGDIRRRNQARGQKADTGNPEICPEASGHMGDCGVMCIHKPYQIWHYGVGRAVSAGSPRLFP